MELMKTHCTTINISLEINKDPADLFGKLINISSDSSLILRETHFWNDRQGCT